MCNLKKKSSTYGTTQINDTDESSKEKKLRKYEILVAIEKVMLQP